MKTNKNRKSKKTTKYQKKLFSYQSKFSFFGGGCPKIPFFDNLAQKARTQKNTIKIGVSARHFWKNSYASRNGHFWTKKSQIQKFQLSFFCLFSSLSTTTNINICWKPYFYSVLVNLKKRIFKKWTWNREIWRKTQFWHLFWKRLFLENCQIIGHRLQKVKKQRERYKLSQEKAKMRKKTKHWNVKTTTPSVCVCVCSSFLL